MPPITQQGPLTGGSVITPNPVSSLSDNPTNGAVSEPQVTVDQLSGSQSGGQTDYKVEDLETPDTQPPSGVTPTQANDQSVASLDTNDELSQPTAQPEATAETTPPPERKNNNRRVIGGIFGLAALVVAIIAFLLLHHSPVIRPTTSATPDQAIKLSGQNGKSNLSVLGISTGRELYINADVITSGSLYFKKSNGYYGQLNSANLTNNQQYTLPDSSGTVCLDSNNCKFALASNIITTSINGVSGAINLGAGLSMQGTTLVNSQIQTILNGFSGSVLIQGTANRISVSSNGGTITLSTPQDIATTSSPTFAGLNATTLNITGTTTTINGLAYTWPASQLNGVLVDNGTGGLSWSSVAAACPTCFVNGGNSFGSTAILGTNDNNNLVFETNSINRVTIDTTGNVGISAASNGAKLYVPYQNGDVGGVPGSSILGGNALMQAGDSNNNNNNLIAVDGESYSGIGVQGISKTGVGVAGYSTGSGNFASGVLGYNSSSGGAGVLGLGGLFGSGDGIGVAGYSGTNYGIFGQSANGISGFFQSTCTGLFGCFGSSAQPTLVTQQYSASTTDLFQARDSSSNARFAVGYNGHVGIGNGANAAIDDCTLLALGSCYNVIGVQESVTDFSKANINGINNNLLLSPSADVTSTVAGVNNYVVASPGVNNYSTVRGDFTELVNDGTGTISFGEANHSIVANFSSGSIAFAKGGQFDAFNVSTGSIAGGVGTSGNVANIGAGTITTAEGASFSVANAGAGTINTAAGVDVQVVGAAGTITDAYGVRLFSPTVGGTITNNYGLYIQDQSGAGSVNSYNLYSAGTGKNYFGGLIVANTLGAANTATYLCQNASNQVAACNTTGNGAAFVQGGNSFGAQAVLGTNDNNSLAIETNGTTRVTVDTSGGVTVHNQLAVGSTSAITANQIVNLAETYTATSGNLYGVNNAVLLNPSGASTAVGYGTYDQVSSQAGNANNITAGIGGEERFIHNGSGTVTVGYGNYGYVSSQGGAGAITTSLGSVGQVDNWSSSTLATTTGTYGYSKNAAAGAITTAYGAYGDVDNTAGGTVTSAYGLSSLVQNTGAGTITTATGLYVQSNVKSAGTLTNNYGINVKTQTAGSNNYGIAVEAASTQTLWISSDADNTTASAGISFGLSRDTNLYRSAAGTLKTDTAFSVGTTLTVGTLGAANTATYLCRNASNQVATCNTTGTGAAFVQGGNSFGATATLGTNDNNNLNIITNSSIRLIVDSSTGAISSNGGQFRAVSGTAATPGYAFNSSTNTGLYLPSVGVLGITTAGNEVGRWGSQGLEIGSTGSPGTVEKLRVNLPNTVDNTAAAIIATGADANRGLVIQANSGGQSADLQEWQNSSGTSLAAVDSGGRFVVTTLGTTNTATYLCRNASNQVATCNTTGTGAAFVQGGNSFGALATLGTNDGNNLAIETNGVTRATIDQSNNIYFGNGITAATPNNFTINSTGSTTAGTAGGNLTINGGAGTTNGAGSTGGTLTLQGGNAGGSNIAGANLTIAGGQGTGTGNGGTINFQIAKAGVSGSGNNALSTVASLSGSNGGAALFQNSSNSTTAFQIKNSGGTSQLIADTTDGVLAVGNNATTNAAIALNITHTFNSSNNCAFTCIGTFNDTTVNNPSNPSTVSASESRLTTSAIAFTLTNAIGYYAMANVLGAGSTITNNYGIVVDPQTVGSSNFGIAVGAATTSTLWLSKNADNTTASAGISFGLSRDTNLYRSAANTLKTDSQLSIGTLGATNNVSYLCLNSSNILAACQTNVTGSAFVQGGNSFGAQAVLGTSDNNSLQIKTNNQSAVTIASGGATTFQNNTNSTTAFQIQDSSSNNLFQADTSNYNLTFNGVASGLLQTWSTNGNALPATLGGIGTATANGYVYVIGGYNGTTQVSTVYYAPLNKDGSTGAWTTNANALPTALRSLRTVIVNGYIYVTGGYNGAAVSTVYYAKLNSDGSTGAWQTDPNALPGARYLHTAVTANGYIYIIGGYDGGSAQSTVYYAKVNADGSTGTWSTNANAVPAVRYTHGSAVANGYVYVVGGFDGGGNSQSTVYYAQLNADGSTGTWSTNANALPSITSYDPTIDVSNGFVYVLGGSNANGSGNTPVSTVYYAALNNDGSTGTWSTNTNALPGARSNAGTIVSNGYVYDIGGYSNSTTVQSTVYYSSASRIKVGGNIDLVGLNGGSLNSTGDYSSGSVGGSITAGNGTFIGALQVNGQSNFTTGVGIGGALAVQGGAYVYSSPVGSTTLSVDGSALTTGTGISLNATALTSGNGLIINGPTSGATLTGNLLNVNTASTGAATNGFVRYNFTGAHTGNGIQLDDSTVTGTAFKINANSLTSGSGLFVQGTNATLTGNLFAVQSASTGTAANGFARFNFTGAHTGTSAGQAALEVNDATATGIIAEISSSTLTSGFGLWVNSTSSSLTGAALQVSSNSTSTPGAGLVRFNFTGAHTGASAGNAAFEVNDATATGIIQEISSSTLTSGFGLWVNMTSGSMTGNAVQVASNTTGALTNGIVRFNFTGAHTNTGFQIDDATATGNAMLITGSALTSGNALYVHGTNAAQTGSSLLVDSNSTGAVANGLVRFNFTGAHTGNGIQVDDVTATGTALKVNANSLTSGRGIYVTANNATFTGSALEVDTNTTGLANTGLVYFSFSAAHTGNGFYINDAGTGIAESIQTTATTGTGLIINNNNASFTGTDLQVTSNTTALVGSALAYFNFTGAHTGYGMWISDVTATGTAERLQVDSLTSGYGLYISGNNTSLTGNLLYATTTSTSAASNGFIRFNFTGAHTGNGLEVDDSTANGTIAYVSSSSLTGGIGLRVNIANTAQTGPSLEVDSSSTSTFNTGAVYINISGAHGGDGLYYSDSLTNGIGADFRCLSQTGGICLRSTSTNTAQTGPNLELDSSSTSALNNGLFYLNFSGAYTGGAGIYLSSGTATGWGADMRCLSLTSGTCLRAISNNAAQTGPSLEVDSSSTSAVNTGLAYFNFNAAHTGYGIYESDATATGTAFQINATSLTSGNGMLIQGPGGSTFTGSLARFLTSTTGNPGSQGFVDFQFTGARTGGYGVEINDGNQTGGTALNIDVQGLTGGNGLVIAGPSSATFTGNLLHTATSSTGNPGLSGFVQFGASGARTGGTGVEISDNTTGGTALNIDVNNLTSGYGLRIAAPVSTVTGALLYVYTSSTSASSSGFAYLQFSGAHTGNGFQLDDATATGTSMQINPSALTTGTGLQVNATNSAQTGDTLLVNSNSTGAAVNGLARFNFTGAHTNNGLQVDDATTSGNAVAINSNSNTSGLALKVSATGETNVAQFLGSGGTQCTVVTGTGWSCSSDATLKTNITSVNSTNALAIVNLLNPVTYNWIADPNGLKQDGFIAQDIQKVLPELVTTDSNGHLSLSKDGLLPYMVGAIQEQQKEIQALQQATGNSSSGGIQQNGSANLTSLNVSGATNLSSLTVSGAATVAQLTVTGNTTVAGNLTIQGHVLGNTDTRGTITIPAGQTQFKFTFVKPYDANTQPNVILTPKNTFAPSYRVDSTNTDFTVYFQTPSTTDVIMNYQVQQ